MKKIIFIIIGFLIVLGAVIILTIPKAKADDTVNIGYFNETIAELNERLDNQQDQINAQKIIIEKQQEEIQYLEGKNKDMVRKTEPIEKTEQNTNDRKEIALEKPRVVETMSEEEIQRVIDKKREIYGIEVKPNIRKSN